MQKVAIFGAVTALFFLFTPATRGQDAGEVERLRKDNELLKKENELLKKENELLKKEIELLKREPQARPNAAKDPKAKEKKPRTKVEVRGNYMGELYEYELVKCVRGQEPTWVTFTFAVRPLAGVVKRMNPGRVGRLILTTADGKKLQIDPVGRPQDKRRVTVHLGCGGAAGGRSLP